MDNNNLIVAIVLSVLILFGFQYYYVKPQTEAAQQRALMEQEKKLEPKKVEVVAAAPRSRDEVLKDSPRLKLATSQLQGSINLKGARLDDLKLTNYHEAVVENSPGITLLSPSGSALPYAPYYADFGWLAADSNVAVPEATTTWQADAKQLSENGAVTLRWDSGKGLSYERKISLDNQFMFTITDRVVNKSAQAVTLYPYAAVARQGDHTTLDGHVILEGGIGVLSGTVEEFSFSNLTKELKRKAESPGGWIGMTDKYWLTAIIPPQDKVMRVTYSYDGPENPTPSNGHFQSDYRGEAVVVKAGGDAAVTTHFFAGAKLLKTLDGYAGQYNIPHFDKAIHFGWFYFLTKPFLYVLDWLGTKSGSFAMAILIFTVLLKLATLNLSIKSYKSMAKMKALQPEILKLQERYADDKMRFSQEQMALFAREKVNPMSGCVPMLIQIPIFFALYKVLFVSIELRQAPFWGWISDMSLPDPTNLFTLFGLIPVTLPSFMPALGAWPLFMGLSMFLQQKMSPQPPDKVQARMFLFMPIFFTFLLSHSPAGLVIYWTWSNLLSIAQQAYIMRRHDVPKSA